MLKSKTRILFIFCFMTGLFLFWGQNTYAIELENFKLYGFADFEYERRIEGEAGSDEFGSFDQYHFEVITSYYVTPKLSALLYVEYEHAPKSDEIGGYLAVNYSLIEYAFMPEFKVRFGTFYTPVGLYNELHSATPAQLTYRIPKLYRMDEAGGFMAYNKRDTGLMALGGVEFSNELELDYKVSITNGDTVSKRNSYFDDNLFKAINLWTRLQILEGLSVLSSVYIDRISNKDNEDNVDQSLEQSKLTWYMGAQMDKYNVILELEFMASIIGENEKSGKKEESENGFGMTLGYRYQEKYTPYIQYNLINPDENYLRNDELGLECKQNSYESFSFGININLLMKGS